MAETRPDAEVLRASLARIVRCWLFVCSLSAIPSFFFGFGVSNGQVAGMILGILIFVIAYTILDYTTASRPFRRNRQVRRTLKIAYGTRIAISIIFPLGAYVDIFCGFLSIGLIQSVSGFEFRSSEGMSFGATLLTTLVQGVLLNIALACYAMVVHGVQLFVSVLRR
jgi:hypothetical protein